MKNLQTLAATASLLALTTGSALAASSVNYDFGDATGYGDASHKSPEWQRLGANVNSESGTKAVDDGVSWSTDGGSTFGHGDIYQGDTLTIRFDFRRAAYGRHSSDTLAAWIDWNQDMSFDNVGEEIVHDVWLKNSVEHGNTVYADNLWRDYVNTHGVAPNPTATLQKFVDVTLNIAADALTGDFWLRARVACNTSQHNKDPYNLSPYGYSSQGEAEDYLLTILESPEGNIITVVPSPAAAGAGLLGVLGLIGRRRRA